MNDAVNGEGAGERPIKLSCRNVWKVYGPDPAGFARNGGLAATDRAEMRRRLKESGHLGAAIDVRDRKSTRLNSSHSGESRMPSSA